MVKTIIKETIVLLLILTALILGLGVLFYDYIPNNKVVPSVNPYRTSETVQKELSSEVTEEEPVLVTYEITSSDLKNLTNTNTYTPGKQNPFSTYVTEVEGDGSTVSGGNVTGGTPSSGNSGNTVTSSGNGNSGSSSTK